MHRDVHISNAFKLICQKLWILHDLKFNVLVVPDLRLKVTRKNMYIT